MAQDTTPAIVVYQGDGSNTVFSVPFDKGYYGEVKVLFVRRGLADYTYNPNTYTVSGRLYAWASGSAKVYTHTPNPAVGAPIYSSADVEQADTVSAIAGQTITVDSVVYSRAVQHDIMNNLLLTWTGTMLEVGDFICIARDTERGQPYEMPNNQKHIEKALDNLERQIQEVKDATDNALLVDPSHTIDSNKMDPIDWMKSIVRSTDFSARGLRFANGWLDYSTDDPNIAEADKTWNHILNTDNIKNIRERSDIVDGVTVYWTEYQASDGTWRTLANTSYWESRIQYAVDTAEDAKDVADDAKDIAQDAKDIADTFDGRLTQAETDASDAKTAATGAVNTVNSHVTNYNNPHQVTKTQIGLGNCDNTSDLNKPISTATQNALDLKLPTSTKYGAALSLTINSTTYVVTAQLKDQDGNNLGTAQTIDLPLESVVVSGSYDSATKEVVLTLQGGSTIRFSVADLVSGLQTEITSSNMLSADLVDDTSTTHKFVTTTEKSTWSGKQDAISDLTTIRSGAAAGATAVQPGDLATYVTTNTTQTISGEKTFSGKLNYCAGMTYILAGNGGAKLGYWSYDVDGQQNITLQTMTASTRNINFKTNNGGKVTYNGSEIAKLSNIPTTTSALTNDSGFITSSDIPVTDVTVGGTSVVSSGVAAIPTIPTTLAALTGDVSLTTPAGGDHLVFDSVTQKWKNTPSSASISWGGITGTLADQTDLQNALDAKQATLVSGTNIKTINGTSVLGSGDITISAAPDIDNSTITKNGDDELQAVATINANTAAGATNPVYDWVGTLAEYEAQAVATNHPDWVCYITDDCEATAYQAYTQSQCNSLFVQKGHQVIDFQEPTAANNYTWYRKYADGWVEQGGKIIATIGTSDTAWSTNLIVPMSSNEYFVSVCAFGYAGHNIINPEGQTSAVLKGYATSNVSSSKTILWYVSGMAA